MKYLLRLALMLLLAVSGTVAYMVTNEKHYIYFPERNMLNSPQSVGMAFSVQHFTSKDGIKLYGWYMPEREADYVLLSLHGNAGNISYELDQYRRWHDMGLSVFAFDYRGYGGSQGEPSEAGLYADADAAWELLTGPMGIPAERIIIAGRSQGCAVAAHLAAKHTKTGIPAGLALEVPFTSIPDMSADHYPWLPLRWFVRTQFDTRAELARVTLPLLLISAKSDEIVPHWMAGTLFDAYKGEKLRGQLDGGHNDFDRVSEKAYIRLWEIWLDSLGTPEQQPLQWVRLSSLTDA